MDFSPEFNLTVLVFTVLAVGVGIWHKYYRFLMLYFLILIPHIIANIDIWDMLCYGDAGCILANRDARTIRQYFALLFIFVVLFVYFMERYLIKRIKLSKHRIRIRLIVYGGIPISFFVILNLLILINSK